VAGTAPPTQRGVTTGLSNVDGLVLSLVPAPERGNSPLAVNVTATITGGTAPYSLSVCFSIADHSSLTPDCAPMVTGWNGASPLVFPHVYSLPGNYSVLGIASDARGSSVGSTALIVVTSGGALVVAATESIDSGAAPLAVTFTATVTGGTPPESIQWSFGDGASGSAAPGSPVTHVYAQEGRFVPQILVSDAAGHLAAQSLAPVSVGGASNSPATWGGLSPSDGASAVLTVLSAAIVGVAAVAVGIRFYQVRRWRREGSALVQELEEGPRSPTRPPPFP